MCIQLSPVSGQLSWLIIYFSMISTSSSWVLCPFPLKCMLTALCLPSRVSARCSSILSFNCLSISLSWTFFSTFLTLQAVHDIPHFTRRSMMVKICLFASRVAGRIWAKDRAYSESFYTSNCWLSWNSILTFCEPGYLLISHLSGRQPSVAP